MDNLTKGLIEAGHDVKVLCISSHKHPFKAEALSAEYQKLTEIEAVYVDTRLNFVDAFSNLITRDSYNVSRFFSPDLDSRLENILQEGDFDVVQLESLFMTPYSATVRRCSKARLILRSHNLEYKIWQRMARVSANGPRKAYLKILAKRLKEYELSVMRQVDGIATISPEDTVNYEALGCTQPIVTIPFGIDTTEYPCDPIYNFTPSLFHLGAMDWMPNVEGVEWFLENVWADILKDYPKFRFHLAGKASDRYELPKTTKSISLDGVVPDAKVYMAEQGIMIVPLLSGGGMRIKIIEGMALGKVIISTSIGAEGIGATHAKDILIADNPADFKAALNSLHEDAELAQTISRNARKFVEQHFDNSVLTDRLIKFYSGITPVPSRIYG